MPTSIAKRAPLKVVNLFGAPGIGKSSVRAGLFWLMKSRHHSVEEVTEFAKQLVLEGTEWQLRDNQIRLLADQHHRQLIISRNGYKFAVTDSPLLLCSFYAPPEIFPSFHALAHEAHASFENFNFLLTRNLEGPGEVFEDRGRLQTREESMQIAQRMQDYLEKNNIAYTKVPVNEHAPARILSHLEQFV